MAGSTAEIRVETEVVYAEEKSDIASDVYVFVYTIRITNRGARAVQLISRHWIITDAGNQVQEVRGMGVVGEQPLIGPGQTYEYSSGTALHTPFGTMRGKYHLQAEDGERLEADIPEMVLVARRVLH